MLLGITGKKGSGKDTFHYIASSLYENVERRAFADKLKESAAALLNVDVDFLERHKFDDNNHLEYGCEHYIKDMQADIWYNEGISLTIRQFLQRYGTEAHRDVFGENFWLEQCLPYHEENRYYYNSPHNLIIVTDVRFDNEAQWIWGLGGQVWEVRRSSVDSDDTHASEIPVDPEWVHQVISNDGSLEDYRAKVEEVLDGSWHSLRPRGESSASA